jgi:hypothetical protein
MSVRFIVDIVFLLVEVGLSLISDFSQIQRFFLSQNNKMHWIKNIFENTRNDFVTGVGDRFATRTSRAIPQYPIIRHASFQIIWKSTVQK